MNNYKNILVTGAAGFIGYYLCESLIKIGYNVVGLDNINDYYDVNLKFDRLKLLGIKRKNAIIFNVISQSSLHGSQMRFIRMNLQDRKELPVFFKKNKFDYVCNLAAQPGVRYSLDNPNIYIDSNINGFLNILECCRHHDVKRLIYASSSSVYGNHESTPFKETAKLDQPVSLYAATKKSNELMAYTYSHLYKMETIGLRFFTVYGPWGRPDMAMFLFTDAIINNKILKVFNNGYLSRDFTYVKDIVDGVVNVLTKDLKDSPLYKLYNIGNNSPVKLMDFIESIEDILGLKANKQLLPMQPGDVNQTWADVSKLQNDYGYKPKTSVKKGVQYFIDWYKSYYNLS